MQALLVAKSVYIKQSIEWIEIISGYETPNRYVVYYKDFSSNNYTMLFSCKEMSGYCERNCCSGDSRPFTMNLKHYNNQNIDKDFNNNVFAVLNKPYKLSCYCIARPEMNGNFGSLTGPSFGKITQPYTCCDPVFKVHDNNNNVVYSITTDCCKCGFFCRGGCGMFESLTFLIFKGDECDSKNIEGACGKIVKHSMGIQSLLSDADNFEVFFPNDASPEDKMSLISSALMIDYMFFEENPNQK